ncbi:hypothetical protein [Paenibacillus terrigena]|uniref:hypothetical protein n=1 Tax=Paenibacillus terrigena TaxID=369333 RepID=UPI00037347E2|nr:hypothetical protein [Paenibacillus terrigena]
MSRKVTIPNEVADAIERLRDRGVSNAAISLFALKGGDMPESQALASWVCVEIELRFNTLMSALINGYERELTQEQRIHAEIRRAYERWRGYDFSNGIMFSLDKLGIQIEGVNV